MILRRLTKHVKDQNWFAVGLDFVIVVIGVGVALMGQQWLSDRQERADMRVAEAAVQIDLFTSYFSALERVAVADCRKEAYAAIAAQLLETGETWIPMTLVDETSSEGNVLPRVLRSPLKSWGSRNWDAGLARGTFNQMDDERRSAFDNLFQQTEYAAVTQSEIFTLQSRMKKLAVTTTISPDDRSRYYDILGELDDKSALLEMFSSGIIRQIGAIGFELPDEFVSGELERLAGQNAFRETYFGACYVPMEFSLLSSNASAEEAP